MKTPVIKKNVNNIDKIKDLEPRKKKSFKRNSTFGFSLSKDLDIEGYETPTIHTPQVNPDYVFPVDATRVFLLGLYIKDRILLTGHTGTGKSTLVEQIAARLNYNVIKISFDSGITRNDLIGEWIVKNNETIFNYGVLPMAMQMPGTIILFDEWDSVNEDAAFTIHRPLQKDDGKLLILENGGELVRLHRDNTICATANTIGQGDSTGLYSHGTRIQNFSQLNRFSLTIKMDWLSEEQEKKMLKSSFKDLKDDEISALTYATKIIRDGFVKGDISVPLSTRDLLNWAEKYAFLGRLLDAAQYCFLNRMTDEDAEVCKGIIQRVFEVH